MARQEKVTLIDDIDGGKADETVTFALDGATYEIDLHKKKASALRKGLAEFLAAGRPLRSATAPARARGPRTASSRPAPVATSAPTRSRRRSATAAAEQSAAEADSGLTTPSAEATAGQIRQWAAAEGIAVSERGRVSDSVRQQYLAAHQ